MKKAYINKLISLKAFSFAYRVVNMSIGFNGDVWMLLQNKKIDSKSKKYDHDKLLDSYEIYAFKDGDIKKIFSIKNQGIDFDFIREIDHENILLSSARCEYINEKNIEKNVMIFNIDGKLKKSMIFGDGIQDIKINKEGEIWTSYFDEGVFGNYGWVEPIGQNGLRAWGMDGTSIYDYEAADHDHAITDCYALNIDKNSNVWFYFYTEFYLARYSNGSLKYYNIDADGTGLLVIDGNFIITDFGYTNRNALRLHKIEDDKIYIYDEFELYDMRSKRKLEWKRSFEFEDKIIFIVDEDIYMTDVSSLVDSYN